MNKFRQQKNGVRYHTSFSFPVVSRGTDRIRTQMSAALEIEDLDFAIKAFTEVGEYLKII